MQRTIEDITTELIRLPKKDRLEIARFLLFLDNRSSDTNDTDAAWEQEISDRVLAVNEGTAIGLDYDEAMKKIDKKRATETYLLLAELRSGKVQEIPGDEVFAKVWKRFEA
jgi:hypothetical protein